MKTDEIWDEINRVHADLLADERLDCVTWDAIQRFLEREGWVYDEPLWRLGTFEVRFEFPEDDPREDRAATLLTLAQEHKLEPGELLSRLCAG